MRWIFTLVLILLLVSPAAFAEENDYTEETYDYDDPGGPLKHLDSDEQWEDVSGSDMDGDYVSGEVEVDPSGEGEGYVTDEEGNMSDIEVDSDEGDEIGAHDEGGAPYDLDKD
jgi:hypothetical protein